MAAISAKENYLRLGRGEMPEYVPSAMPYRDRFPNAFVGAFDIFMPEGVEHPMAATPGKTPPTEYVDRWGVPHVANKETGFAALPKPGAFILDSIHNWKKVVKHPKWPENIDWDMMVKKQLDRIDRSQTAVTAIFATQVPFQQMMGFMGFEEGLMALHDEPEEAKELINYLGDWYEPLVIKTLDHFRPDILQLADDTASRDYPFFSLEIYREIFRPFYARMTKQAKERGIFVEFHNCGRCEAFVPDMVEIGVNYWDPAQTDNNLLAVKEKFRGKLAICGGWDFVPSGPVTEDQIRASVRASIDKYAPGGGYAFLGGFLGDADDRENAMKINGWIGDEVYRYGTDFYKKHG